MGLARLDKAARHADLYGAFVAAWAFAVLVAMWACHTGGS